MQPTLLTLPANNLPYDANLVKCGDSENSL